MEEFYDENKDNQQDNHQDVQQDDQQDNRQDIKIDKLISRVFNALKQSVSIHHRSNGKPKIFKLLSNKKTSATQENIIT